MKLRHLILPLTLPALWAVGNAADENSEPAGSEIKPIVRIGDFKLTNLHFSVFAANSERPAETPEQQIRLLNELINTFMVANSAEGRTLAADPEVKAAMEIANARLLASTVIDNAIENMPVSDEEIEKAYKDKYANSNGREYRARHILLKSESDANAVIAELDQGADFAQLAKEKSIGPSGSGGGDLGWFTPKAMVAPFSEAVMVLKDGEYTPRPVKTRFGWHVIQREGVRDVPVPKLEEVLEEISRDLRTEKLTAFIKGLRDRADIEVIQTARPAATNEEEAPD